MALGEINNAKYVDVVIERLGNSDADIRWVEKEKNN